MRFQDVHAAVGGVPYIEKANARYVFDLIVSDRLTRILELGFAHGTATCYMAAAVQELGGGQVTSVDLLEAKEHFRPSAEEQLAATGLAEYVQLVRMQSGYNWFLHDEIARRTVDDRCEPAYDLCIIDGPKNWTIDSSAFFLADKLLRNGGWLIFDDYGWTYGDAEGRKQATDGITHRELSEDERKIPHIREIFELLVKQHPHYSNLLVMPDTDWAIAQKTASESKRYRVAYGQSSGDLMARLFFKSRRMVRRLIRR